MFSFYLSPFVAKIGKKVNLSAGYADVEYCKSICGMKTKGLQASHLQPFFNYKYTRPIPITFVSSQDH